MSHFHTLADYWGLMGSHVGLMRDSFKTLGSHGPKSFVLVRKEGGHHFFHILTTLVPSARPEEAKIALYRPFPT